MAHPLLFIDIPFGIFCQEICKFSTDKKSASNSSKWKKTARKNLQEPFAKNVEPLSKGQMASI